MEMNKAAIEANKRLAAERYVFQAGQPARESHETLRDIKSLLAEILEILRKDNNS
jgi:xylose isomerase